MENLRKIAWIAAVIAAVAVLVAAPRAFTAEKPAAPPGSPPACPAACLQWEVMLAEPTHSASDPRPLPQLGKPYVEQSPAGWEPFAFGPTGQLVYRRCAR